MAAGSASAQLSADAQKAFTNYQHLAPHRAFVLSGDGKTYDWAGASGADPSGAVANALKRCEEHSKSGCSLYAVNNVVLNGRDWKAAAPPVAPAIGRLRPEFYWDNKGPHAAAGLIVWSHGYLPGHDSTASAPQGEVAWFTEQGYDLYRFDREWIHDIQADAADLVAAVRQAKAMGYRRVILAGQSNGAWTTLEAIRLGAPADGVISVSAAHHGQVKDMRDVSIARADWQKLVRDLKPGPRVFLVIFKDDAFDVGGRTGDVIDAFAKSGVESIVEAYPPGFSGHDAANARGFGEKYGACIRAFIETGARQPPCI